MMEMIFTFIRKKSRGLIRLFFSSNKLHVTYAAAASGAAACCATALPCLRARAR